ncbi:GAF and ANTAR domain-containing protein [Nakamurella deserti]|uniref:GAF and ANTAR domain-containing protein n=1 Tax=Nakamurella deserti TaxID=2164074 RepID=UPI001300602B|nr:GAF and ANTAR domain-containing protein [Nakamurella deserti]
MSETMDRGDAMPLGELAFADGLGSLARAIQQNLSEEVQSLDFIVSAAVELIPGVESAAVSTLAGRNRLAGQSSSGAFAGPVLEAQNATGEGPCLNVAEGGDQVLISDVLADDRWPSFATTVAPIGVRSIVCTPLTGDGSIRGSLSLHATEPGAFNEETRELARVFAAHASIALAGAARHRNIVVALGSRDIIGQAKGILMERFGITADAAFTVLLRMSQHLNIKLRDVSAELCSTGVLPGVTDLQRSRGGAGAATRTIVADAVARTGGATTGAAADDPEVDGVARDALAAGSRDEDVAVEAVLSAGDGSPSDPGRPTSRSSS